MEITSAGKETIKTDPPLNAPTGFRTGNGVASASRLADVWKLRAVELPAMVRKAGETIRDAIVTDDGRGLLLSVPRCMRCLISTRL
jgi:hypothetical protein